MDSSSIDLNGSEIDAIELDQDRLRLHFSRAYIVKTMTGSAERTRWWQSGDLVLEGVEVESLPGPAPLVCEGGDVDDNLYTYRDMMPIPLDTRGRTGCELRFRGSSTPLRVSARALRLELADVPKYIEHIR